MIDCLLTQALGAFPDSGLDVSGRRKKAGLSPGSLVHIGEQKIATVQIRVMDYDEARVTELTEMELERCASFRESPSVTWIDVVGLHQVSVIEKLGKAFGLHPLTQEDILNSQQRPKIEVFDEYVYTVLKMLMLNPETGALIIEQVSVIIGKGYAISFQERPGDVFDSIRGRIRSGKGRIRKCGADYLAYALIDAIVDNYFVILEDLGEKSLMLEDRVLVNPNESIQQEIYRFKRELVILRKAVWPLREMTGMLQRAESSLIAEATHLYLRDLYDHSVQVLDAVEMLRDIMSSLMDIYLSSISNRMNAIMKVLTMIATIFIPLTFIAGVYGMNFEFMPELNWQWSYPLVLLAMLALTLGMVYYFRRKKWL